MLNMCQISSRLTDAVEGHVAEISGFANFEEKKEIEPFDIISENS